MRQSHGRLSAMRTPKATNIAPEILESSRATLPPGTSKERNAEAASASVTHQMAP